MVTFANAVERTSRTVWERVERVLQTRGDEDGWVPRAVMSQSLRLDTQSMVDALNAHAELLERRVVPTRTRPREEFRFKPGVDHA